MKVSIIVPIYGVERFVEKCITSLLMQTWPDLEIIIVDDKSPDKSMNVINQVLKNHPHASHKVKIIHHDENKGLPCARNTGLNIATGEYIFHCDGDDFAEPNMIEAMVSLANKGNYDIVYCDWYLNYGNKDRYMSQPKHISAKSALQALLHGQMKYNVWNKLIKKSLYTENNISFPNGYSMGEDMTMIKLFAKAHNLAYIPKAYYHYVKTNSSAMTENINEQAISQINHNVKSVEDFLKQNGYSNIRSFKYFELSTKYALLYSYNRTNYKIWNSWFNDSNDFALNDNWPFRIKILHFFAIKNLYFLLRLHYAVYSIIYHLKHRI